MESIFDSLRTLIFEFNTISEIDFARINSVFLYLTLQNTNIRCSKL
ncbi:hypothetical protein D3OALGA1CA_1989 [Olavius algarvensis associated proteobacterium Delta 3]|nr:hypothetical protein D3OALGA1CA_1989 [Olavius algarvensis associated proteobacterium Delta 3]CAB5119378.1 hypothetical protein D3OALGB2SA_2883 [Olavius algarvensis associated proteobacterium Delta 3]